MRNAKCVMLVTHVYLPVEFTLVTAVGDLATTVANLDTVPGMAHLAASVYLLRDLIPSISPAEGLIPGLREPLVDVIC